MLIYLLKNEANGKIYVGQTVRTLKHRLGQHKRAARYGRKTYLCNAIRKYGLESFTPRTLETCVSREELNEAEKKWIKRLDATNRTKGYNENPGGESHVMSPEAVAKQAAAIRGRKYTSQHKSRIAVSMLGNKNKAPIISDATVGAIKRACKQASQAQVAKQFGINQSTVSRIVRGLRRKNA
jgi:group I intron endonuclease